MNKREQRNMCLVIAEGEGGKGGEDQEEESRIQGYLVANRRITKYKMSDIYVLKKMS